jgi:hypothetical protein
MLRIIAQPQIEKLRTILITTRAITFFFTQNFFFKIQQITTKALCL